MKKILFSLLACAGVVLTSCDMNTTQYGVIDEDAPLTFDYATNTRNYVVYSSLRGMTTGAWIYATELQCDQFIGLANNGSRNMNGFGNGHLTADNPTVSSAYGSCYAKLAQLNYYIAAANKIIADATMTEDELIEVSRYLAEAKFARAYVNFWLFDHYCQTYDPAKGDTEALGICIVTEYNPEPTPSAYPGRSTMNETLKLINDDLTAAFDGLDKYAELTGQDFNIPGSNYINMYTVAALQARVALVTGEYKTAVDKSKFVIDNSNCSLATGDYYMKMWYDADVKELMFAPYVDLKEASSLSSICEGWNYWWSSATRSDYIPTQATVLSLQEYMHDGICNDIRFYSFVENHDISLEVGKTKGYVFSKYPGVPELSATTNMYLNKPKPFRLSEQYLILAEASALNSDPTTANSAINDLVKARMDKSEGFVAVDYQGEALLVHIRNERSKELMGEGFRVSDLRRWKQSFDRDEDYILNASLAALRSTLALNVKYSADDHRYVWPIPSSEMMINPQLKGQQNPGY